MLILDRSRFPRRPADFIPINVTPLLYRPILGSPEQVVIGVLCSNAAGFHLERANRFEKLACLYGDSFPGVLLAIELGLDVLTDAIKSADFNTADFRSDVLGMSLGEVGVMEGPSLQSVARRWLAAHCSLFAPLQGNSI